MTTGMQGLAGHQVSAGSSGGSDPALFTQAVQIPDMLSWNAAEIAGYTWPIGHEGQVIRIGQTLYCYGGGARGGARLRGTSARDDRSCRKWDSGPGLHDAC